MSLIPWINENQIDPFVWIEWNIWENEFYTEDAFVINWTESLVEIDVWFKTSFLYLQVSSDINWFRNHQYIYVDVLNSEFLVINYSLSWITSVRNTWYIIEYNWDEPIIRDVLFNWNKISFQKISWTENINISFLALWKT